MSKALPIVLLLIAAVVLVGASRAIEEGDGTAPVVAAIPAQAFVLDQKARDDTAKPAPVVSSWQTVSGSTLGPLKVARPSALFVEVNGNYNWDGSSTLPPLSVELALELSKDDAAFERVGNAAGTHVANGGTDVLRRLVVPVGPGLYSLRVRHRFTVGVWEGRGLTRFLLTGGAISVRQLPASCVAGNTEQSSP